MVVHTQYRKFLVASALVALASLSFAEVFTGSDGLRYHIDPKGQSAALTFLAADSTNAAQYRGDLVVPRNVYVPSSVLGSALSLPVTSLSEYACIYCDSLLSVTLPEGFTTIGYSAFSGCSSLQSVQLPSTLTTLSDWAFYADSALLQVHVPAATGRVGSCAFAFCSALDSVSLETGIRGIGSQAFYYCQSIREVTIPWTVDQIGEYAFAYCSSLQRIVVEGRPVAITPEVFEGVDVASCTLVVPSDMVEEYKSAEVWSDFIIQDGGFLDIHLVEEDEQPTYFDFHLEGHTLCLDVRGDAPAILYNLQGRCLAVAASNSGMSRHSLTTGTYILRCGKATHKFSL